MLNAWIEDSRIRDIAHGDPLSLYHPDIAQNYHTDVPDDAQIGWVLIEGLWAAPAVAETPPAPPKTFLHIDYPAESTVGATITLTVDIRFADGSHVPVDAIYSVPIIRSADSQVVDYKKVQFVQGHATLSFVASVPGKYIMDTNQIEPRPTAQIVDYPEIRVYS